ncbi:MAG: hypothetical protein IJ735_02585 [Clostridia bacterium]|nr:hypothetical protein [Clostridia bacterium]
MKKKIVLTFVLFILVFTLVVGLAGCGKNYETREGYTHVVFYNNGADGKESEESLFVEHDTTFPLPTGLTKEGYAFVGWKHGSGLSVRDEWYSGKNDLMTFSAIFERDYRDLDATCAVWDNKGADYTDYAVGEYDDLNVKVMDVVVRAGYKATFYSKRGYKGRADVVCYKGFLNRRVHSMKVERIASEEETFDHALTDDDYAYLLKEYAPKIWWDKEEEYFASTVEDGMANLTRTASSDGYYYEIPGITDPYFMNDFLKGKKDGAEIYGFAVKKEYRYLSLCYYIYEPYNYGKKVMGTLYGNHVGDWEHVSVALSLEENADSATVRPLFMETSYHEWRDYTPYDALEKEGKHPVAYIASKSHGTWASEGTHPYLDLVVFKLTDQTSKGYAWDTWKSIETYVYDALSWQGRGVGDSEWNTCFDKDVFDPNSRSVIHWGNKGMDKGIIYKYFVTGPTGPEQKTSLYNYYTLNIPQTYRI